MMVHSAYFTDRLPDQIKMVPAMAEARVILLNPYAEIWQDPVAKSQAAFAVLYWSTPSPFHVFWHEYAHLSNREATRNKPLTPKQQTMAASISIRAKTNAEEFVSEVYAGLMEGVQYDKDILAAFRRLGGQRP